jgi:hypothetical protein
MGLAEFQRRDGTVRSAVPEQRHERSELAQLAQLAVAQAGFCCGAALPHDLHADPRAHQPMAPISAGWDRRLIAASEELSSEALGTHGIVMIDAGQGARIRVWSTDKAAARAAMPDYWRGFPVDVTGSGAIAAQSAHTGRVGLHNLPGVRDALLRWIYERYGTRPPWLTGGVGIGGLPPSGDRILVGVRTEADRVKIPPRFYGVPVEVDVVGVIYAQPQPQSQAQGLGLPLPRCPAPFGNAPGHIGGSYDWWWCSFGRQAGMAYDPRAAQSTTAGRGVKVTLGPRGRNS